MEYFFKRLEAYIKVRPTEAMKDIIVKIMVEVISIFGIITKEIRQGRTSMRFPIDIFIFQKLDLFTGRYFKKLFGGKDVEDAMQRLDKLTQEEARMAVAESLTITHGIDDTVKDVDEKIQGVDMKVEGIDDKVLSVDSKVQSVDHKVGSVIEGELYRISLPPSLFSSLPG